MTETKPEPVYTIPSSTIAIRCGLVTAAIMVLVSAANGQDLVTLIIGFVTNTCLYGLLYWVFSKVYRRLKWKAGQTEYWAAFGCLFGGLFVMLAGITAVIAIGALAQ